MTDDLITAVRKRLVNHFQVEPQSASVTFLGLEPIDILRFEMPDGTTHYASLGCSRHAMGDPSAMVVESTGPRAELVLTLSNDVAAGSNLHRTLAVLAATPAVEGIVLATEALLDLGESMWKDSVYSAALLFASDIEPVTVGDQTVDFFQVAPLLGTEAAWVRLKGSAALEQAWSEAGIDGRIRSGTR